MRILISIMIWIFACQQLSIAQSTLNVAQGKSVTVSSVNPRYPESLILDGGISKSSTWIPLDNARPPHWVEINLEKYYDIERIVFYNGIPEDDMTAREKEKAAGFYCVKNLKFQYWDDANWTDFPNTELTENRKSILSFDFSPRITAYKIRLIATDGEPIRVIDIQVFGKENPNLILSKTDMKASASIVKDKTNQAFVKISDKKTGKTFKYVGYNQGYFMPGSNATAWVEYSGVNSVRLWASLSEYVPVNSLELSPQVNDLAAFEELKKEVRRDPETNPYIRWEVIRKKAGNRMPSTNTMVLDYALTEMKKRNVDVLMQINSTDFNNEWSNKWQQWLRFYALAFHTAKVGDVQLFAMQNEPNHALSHMKLDQYCHALKITSDAARCAIEDVNKLYNKNLKVRFVSPVTAGTNTNWWATVIASVRTDYRGNPIDYNLLDIFSTHSYNLPAVGYTDKVNGIRNLLVENHPKHENFPIVFTEIGRWMNAYLIDREETMDSPSLFTEWAGIYANNMNNGAYGMWAFKMANTISSTYPRGIKSGHHYTWKGTRFIEDSQENLALNKPVKASGESKDYPASNVTDGNKSDASSWTFFSDNDKWLEIDLQKPTELGGAVVYTGSSSGVYTAPDRAKTYRLQSWDGKQWADIGGASEDKSKYAQVLWKFKKSVTTNKVRLFIEDEGSVKIREIKLFNPQFMKNAQPSYDISGIQRTGEVVRLFAKGFKNEKDLLETTISVEDPDVNINTCIDKETNSCYIWLVNRNNFDYQLDLDLSSLPLNSSSKLFIEEVSGNYYGELVDIKTIGNSKKVSYVLPPQSVQLISIPLNNLKLKEFDAVATTTIKGGNDSGKNFSDQNMLGIALDSRDFSKNEVSYIQFDLGKQNKITSDKAVFSIYGYNVTDAIPYRFHVYVIPDWEWSGKQLTWNNAACIAKNETWMQEVGSKAFIAGELVFTNQPKRHELDVTELLQRYPSDTYTFVLIREARELGDDYDKGKKCVVYSNKDISRKPQLKLF